MSNHNSATCQYEPVGLDARVTEEEIAVEYHETITLRSEAPISPALLKELGVQLDRLGIKTYFFNENEFAIREAQRLLREEGATGILSNERFTEAVLPQVPLADIPLLIRTLNALLLRLSPQDSLTIVDPYFFAEKGHVKEYMGVFEGIFQPIASQLNSIRFITQARFNSNLYSRVEAALLGWNPGLQITHRASELFHDRFWIVDEARGMFVGTSINGIGKRYALADYIREDDVAAIVDELRRGGLI